VPQRFPASPASSPVFARPHPSAENLETAWRRIRRSGQPGSEGVRRGALGFTSPVRSQVAGSNRGRDLVENRPARVHRAPAVRKSDLNLPRRAHANRATGHANPHNSPEPQRFQRPSFSAPVRSRPRPSPDSVEAAWRRNGLANIPAGNLPGVTRQVRLLFSVSRLRRAASAFDRSGESTEIATSAAPAASNRARDPCSSPSCLRQYGYQSPR
jgi:hypothetical protein